MTKGKISTYRGLLERLELEQRALEADRRRREEEFLKLVWEAKREAGQWEENEYGVECP